MYLLQLPRFSVRVRLSVSTQQVLIGGGGGVCGAGFKKGVVVCLKWVIINGFF